MNVVLDLLISVTDKLMNRSSECTSIKFWNEGTLDATRLLL